MCVHTRHCCILHGCKYGEKDCPVIMDERKQEGICEQCHENGYKSVGEVRDIWKLNNRKRTNVLLSIHTPGEKEQQKYALVPSDLLEKYDLDEINGKILNHDELEEKIADQIEDLYHRFGLEESEKEADLAQYLDFGFPITANKVVTFGWAV